MSLAHARKPPAFVEGQAPESQRSSPPSPRKSARVDPAVYISALAVLVLAAALLQVGQRARLATLTYELHNARARLEQLERIQTRLLVEMDEARSLTRIDGEARSRLGMVRPASTQWLVVRPESGGTGEAVSADQEGWFGAVASWYDRVSSGIKAALPRLGSGAGR